jgi:hypothetical protein
VEYAEGGRSWSQSGTDKRNVPGPFRESTQRDAGGCQSEHEPDGNCKPEEVVMGCARNDLNAERCSRSAWHTNEAVEQPMPFPLLISSTFLFFSSPSFHLHLSPACSTNNISRSGYLVYARRELEAACQNFRRLLDCGSSGWREC